MGEIRETVDVLLMGRSSWRVFDEAESLRTYVIRKMGCGDFIIARTEHFTDEMPYVLYELPKSHKGPMLVLGHISHVPHDWVQGAEFPVETFEMLDYPMSKQAGDPKFAEGTTIGIEYHYKP